MENNQIIVRNSILCLRCNDHIVSKSSHDFVTCKCGKVSTDGGRSYQRILGNPEDYKITTISIPDTEESFKENHEVLRVELSWGTYGKDGKSKYKRVEIYRLTTEHIEAILLTQNLINIMIKKTLINELKYRKGEL